MDLEKDYTCYKRLVALVWKKITMNCRGGFGTIKSLATKMKQSLGVSHLNLFAFL
jgi:hypothetical protein